MAANDNTNRKPKQDVPIYIPIPYLHMMMVDDGMLFINADMSATLQKWNGEEVQILQVLI